MTRYVSVPDHQARPVTAEELTTILAHLPERLQLLVELSAWCGLRFGELAALQAHDVDLEGRRIHVRRCVGQWAGENTPTPLRHPRTVRVPEHLQGRLAERAAALPPAGLLFPGRHGHLKLSAFNGRYTEVDQAGRVTRAGWGWRAARDAAGRRDLAFHHLRLGVAGESGTGRACDQSVTRRPEMH